MGLLNFLRTADERAENLFLDEDGFSDDLKELIECVSLEMLEKIVVSRLGDLLLPETIVRLTNKKAKQIGKVVDAIIKSEELELGLELKLALADEHSASGDLALSDMVKQFQREEAARAERVGEKQRAFWEKLGRIVVSKLRNLLMPSAPKLELGSEPKPEPEPELGPILPNDSVEFHDAYSALKAAERTVNDIHVRLLTRGEGTTEKGVVRLVAEAIRIIGCARKMGADADADKIEQKLNRILAKF